MATATVGTTYTRVNLVGPLFHLDPNDTPFLSAIGGINGGRSINAKLFSWQTETNASVSQPAIVEGADATYSEQTPSEVFNTTQIFHKGVEVTYTTLGAFGQQGDFSTRVWALSGETPVRDQRAHQLMLKLATIKKEIEYSFLRGTYQYPSNNSTARKTRGMKAAITTNVVSKWAAAATAATFDYTGGGVEDEWTDTAHGLSVGDEIQFTAVGTGADEYAIDTPYWVVTVPDANTFQLSATKGGSVLQGTADSVGTWNYRKAQKFAKADLDTLIRQMVEGTSTVSPLVRPVLFCGAYAKQVISDIYGYAPMSRTEGGVAIDQIVTDFIPNLGIVFDRWLHPGDAMLADLSVIQPVFMPIPGHPAFFAEELSKTGAAEHWQLYGEVGLQYGPENFHGMITGLTTA